MTKLRAGMVASLILLTAGVDRSEAQQSQRPAATGIERRLKVEVPVVLCIDDKPAVGGQPSTSAYAKAAANGFRSVLTLRAATDGVDLGRERFIVEQTGMRYFNIAAGSTLPQRRQVDEFLGLVRDRANHPMLINCAFAERIAPLMMIFHIVELGWTEKRAVEEASLSGLKSDVLKKFARDYLSGAKKNLSSAVPTSRPHPLF